MYGVTPEGFIAADLQNILSELEDDQRSLIIASLNTQPDSVVGQLNGVFADKIVELWEAMLAVYRSGQSKFAVDEALDNLCALTGVTRLAAAPSEALASLNLDPLVAIPVGSIIGIGLTGSQWITTEAAVGLAVQSNVSVSVESIDSAPVVGNAYAIDSIISPISGWTAKAAITSLNFEPFAFLHGATLTIIADEGEPQQIVLDSADFADITAATAQQAVDAIVAATTGISGLDVAGAIRLFSDTDGIGSAIQLSGGTAYEAIGIPRQKAKGLNLSSSAKIVNSLNEPYDMSGAPTLFVAVDGGSSQSVLFADSDFGTFASGSMTCIEASLYATAVDSDTFVLDDGVNAAVTFAFDDDSSVVASATLRPIDHNNIESQTQVRDLAVTAINSAPLLAITASPGVGGGINLVNNATGVVGNVAMSETVADAGFSIDASMLGGINDTPLTATAIQVARKISSSLSGATAYEVGGKAQIESTVVGINSFLEVTGGAANTPLGYTLADVQHGSSGDAVLGRDIEQNDDLRIRRDSLVRSSGSSTVEAIRAAVRAVKNVTQAFVVENDTEVVDASGRPAKSFEVIVSSGDDTEIAQAILSKKPAGIRAYASPGPDGVTTIVQDSQGKDHSIGHSRATRIQMHVIVDIDVIASEFGGGSQVNGEQEVREAIKAMGDALDIGQDLKILKFKCVPIDLPGVDDVTDMRIENVDPPTNTANIVFLERELGVFSTADIDINVTFV